MKRLLSTLMFGLAICATSQLNAQFYIGDINGDGVVDWENDYDFQSTTGSNLLVDLIVADVGYFPPGGLSIFNRYDLNKDGYITVADAGLFQDLLHYRRGDINKDCSVDFLDIQLLIDSLGSGTYTPLADINEDNQVNFLDIQGFIDSLSGNPPTSVVEIAFYDPAKGFPGVVINGNWDSYDSENEFHKCLSDGVPRSPESYIVPTHILP